MSSEKDTVAEILREMKNATVIFGPGPRDSARSMTKMEMKLTRLYADRVEAAHRREYEKYKEHINELNRQILVLKHGYEKRETYLCGYDPDEALVMQCGTCRFFQKKHSHCTHHDSLTSAKYKCSEWKLKTNDECAKEASKKHDEEIVRLRREVAELRECLREAVDYQCGKEKCEGCFYCEINKKEECIAYKWRKAVEGVKDEKDNP